MTQIKIASKGYTYYMFHHGRMMEIIIKVKQ
jgi:hypothetical protein